MIKSKSRGKKMHGKRNVVVHVKTTNQLNNRRKQEEKVRVVHFSKIKK